jgi:hypothetical protein
MRLFADAERVHPADVRICTAEQRHAGFVSMMNP